MYPAYQAHTDLLWPLRTATRLSLPFLQQPGIADAGWLPARQWSGGGKVFELAQITHTRPPWRIGEIVSGDERWPITEEATLTTPFATLLRFRKAGAPEQPKVLVVAPMSGHFATLLRGGPCARCCRTTTSTSPTGTTCATCRWQRATSGWTSTPGT